MNIGGFTAVCLLLGSNAFALVPPDKLASPGNREVAHNEKIPVENVQGFNVWTIGTGENQFRITDFGANVISVKLGGREILWHKDGGKTVRQENGLATPGGIPFMWPWTSRIENGKVIINGKEYDLLDFPYMRKVPDADKGPNILHGVTDKVRWDLVAAGADFITLSKRARDIVINKDGIETLADVFGDVEIKLTYRIVDNEFACTVVVVNLSAVRPAIFTFGHHNFLKLGATLKNWFVRILARKYWKANDLQVPLPQGPMEVNGTAYDYTKKIAVHKAEIGLTGLEEEGGQVVSRFENEVTGEALEITQDGNVYRNIMYWVPEDNPALEGVASIQPTTSPANAINMAEKGIAEAAPCVIPAKGKPLVGTWGIRRIPPGENKAQTAILNREHMPAGSSQ